MLSSTIPWIALSLLSRLVADAEPPSPIVNGRPAADGELPMAGALLYELHAEPEEDAGDDPTELVVAACSSVLIAADVVLTAAHCVEVESAEAIFWSTDVDLTAYASETSDMLEPPQGAIRAIGSVAHPSFDKDNVPDGLGHNSDLGLVFLERAVDIEPGYIPTEPDELAEGMMLVAVGWGARDGVLVEDAGIKTIAESPIGALGQWELQIGPATADARQCHGDSGGPALAPLVEVENAWRVVGIASHTWDDTQCTVTGAVNTRVAEYRDWIEAEMIRACNDGTRVACDEPGLPTPAAAGSDDGSSSDGGSTGGEPAADGGEAGCGCREGGAPGQGGLLLLGAAVLLLCARRRLAHGAVRG